MALVPAPNSSPVIFNFVNNLQRQINPANPAIEYAPKGQGTKRRRERELAKFKANKAADAQRKKNAARKAKQSDVVFMDDGEVLVLGQRVGIVKQMGDKAVLFDNAADEISSRARVRDLKKAAAELYVAPAKEPSRQVRRRLERKDW